MNITGFIKFPSNLEASEIGWKVHNLETCLNNSHPNIKSKIPTGLILPISDSNTILGKTLKSIQKKVLLNILTSSRIIRDEIGKKQYGKQYEESMNKVDDLFNAIGEKKLIKTITKYLRDGDKRIRMRLNEVLVASLGDDGEINSDEIIKDIVRALNNIPTWEEEINKIKEIDYQKIYIRSSSYTGRYRYWWNNHRGVFESIPSSTSQSNETLTQKIAKVYLSIFNDKGFKMYLDDIDTFGLAIFIQPTEDVDTSGIITSKYEGEKIVFTFTFLEGFCMTINDPKECKDVDKDSLGYYQKSTNNRINLDKEECMWCWDGISIDTGEKRPMIKPSRQDHRIVFDRSNSNNWIVIRANRINKPKLSPEQLTILYNLSKYYFNVWRDLKHQKVEIKIEFVFVEDKLKEVQIVQNDAIEV